jgi:hypothetical protein
MTDDFNFEPWNSCYRALTEKGYIATITIQNLTIMKFFIDLIRNKY